MENGLDLDNEELLREAKSRFKDCEDFYSSRYADCEEDWRFLHGEGQWDEAALNARRKSGRPALTINQLLPYAHQVTNDIKQARMAIRVIPIDSNADVDTAEIRAGIIRNIEKQSRAKTVYGTAAMNAVGAGIGWMRVSIDYANNYSFEQEAKIHRIMDFKSVYLDPSFESVDGSDAMYGFVVHEYTKERFEELYPDLNPVSFTPTVNNEEVAVVEYFYKECEKKTLHEVVIEGETVQLFSKRLKELDEMEIPYEKKRKREVDAYKVYHCLLTGDEVISKELVPTEYIPIIPVIGQEYWVNGKREFHSLIKQAKDAQQMFNYWKTASTEMVALQPRAPFIAPVGSFQSFPDEWANANNENKAFLEYDIVHDPETGQLLPPPSRQPPAQGSMTMMQEANSAREDIRLSLGMPQSNMGERSNAVSGIAIRNQQIEGDNATFHFMDNLASSIAQVGRILNQMIPTLYSDATIARMIGEDEQEKNIPVNMPYVRGEDGIRPARREENPEGIYDLNTGKYDIDLDVGASYSSKRQETADKLSQLISAKPELVEVVGDLAIEALDLPMSRQIAERLRVNMNPAYFDDDPQAAKLQEAGKMIEKMQEQLLNMEAALADKSKNTQFEQAAKAEEAQLARDKFMIEAEKTKADIAKIYADIQAQGVEMRGQSIDNMEAVIERIDDLSGAVNIILDDLEADLMEEETGEPEQPEETQANEELNE